MTASALPDGREVALDADDDVTRPAGLDASHGVQCFVPSCARLVEVSPLYLDSAQMADRHAVGAGELLTPARGHTPLEVDLRVEWLAYVAQSAGRLVGEGGFLEEADSGWRSGDVGAAEIRSARLMAARVPARLPSAASARAWTIASSAFSRWLAWP